MAKEAELVCRRVYVYGDICMSGMYVQYKFNWLAKSGPRMTIRKPR
jgi:hypothetical protein